MWVNKSPAYQLPQFLFKKLFPVFTALLNNAKYSNVCPIANDRRIPLSGLLLLNNNKQLYATL
jgi:hypothetical protein